MCIRDRSNISCGFDILGFPIHGPGDEIIASFCDEPGIHITEITGAKGRLPYETEKNTAGVAGLAVLKHLGKDKEVGIKFKLHKKMPFGSGMGSSAASAVAGAMAVNELLKKPLTKRELLPFASKGELLASGGSVHLDNVAPSLIGGMVLVRSSEEFDVHRIFTQEGVYCTLIYPEIEILTAEARAILSDTVTLHNHVKQSANLGGLILGMQRGDLDLVKRCLQDFIIEPQRAKLIKGFYEVQAAALEAGALGCSISGAGPSIYSLNANSLIAERVGEAMKAVYRKLGIKSKLFISAINHEGAIKL